jgi:hypothetical protein
VKTSDPIYLARLVGYIRLLDAAPTVIYPIFNAGDSVAPLLARLGDNYRVLDFVEGEAEKEIAFLPGGILLKKGDPGIVGYELHVDQPKLCQASELSVWLKEQMLVGSFSHVPFSHWSAANKIGDVAERENAQKSAISKLSLAGIEPRSFATISIIRPIINEFISKYLSIEFSKSFIYRVILNDDKVEIMAHSMIDADILAAAERHATSAWERLRMACGPLLPKEVSNPETASQDYNIDKVAADPEKLYSEFYGKAIRIAATGHDVIAATDGFLSWYRQDWGYFLKASVGRQSIQCMDISRDGEKVIFGSDRHCLIEMKQGGLVEHNPRIEGFGNIRACSFSDDGSAAVAASDNGWVSLWNLITGALVTKVHVKEVCLLSVALDTPSGNVIAGSSTGEIFLIDANEGSFQEIKDETNAFVWGAAIRGSRAITIDWNGQLSAWNAANCDLMGLCMVPSGTIRRCDLNANGNGVACMPMPLVPAQ